MEFITLNVDRCKALGDPMRAMIVYILAHKTLNAEGIARELEANGYKKAITTLRHHIDILKEADLIEVAYTKEKRGTLEKYYRSKVIFLGFNDRFVDIKSSVEKDISRRLARIIDSIARNLNDTNYRCKYCNANHDLQYAIIEIINRALSKALEE